MLYEGLAYDRVGRSLLWSHKGPVNKIYSLSQGHTEPIVVYSSLDNPAHLTVDSQRR